jgi:hypothetical protein
VSIPVVFWTRDMLQHGSATATQLAHLVYLVIGIRVCATSSRGRGALIAAELDKFTEMGLKTTKTIHQTTVDLSVRDPVVKDREESRTRSTYYEYSYISSANVTGDE